MTLACFITFRNVLQIVTLTKCLGTMASLSTSSIRCRDTQHNDIKHNYTITLSIMTVIIASNNIMGLCIATLSIMTYIKVIFSIKTNNKVTFSIMTGSKVTFSTMTVSIMTVSIMTVSIMTVTIMTVSITINKTRYSWLCNYAESHL
jgi:hypothetical protein